MEAGRQYIIEIMVGAASKVANDGLDTFDYSPVFTVVNASSTTSSATVNNSETPTSQISTTSGYQPYEAY